MIVAILSSAWLGLMCAISPCPLATNLAAVSVLAHKLDGVRNTLLSGVAYALGRVATSVFLAVLLMHGMAAAPMLSQGLQKYGNRAVGPALIVVAVVLLDLLPFRLPSVGMRSDRLRRLANAGFVGAFAMGCVFALALCPPSAALFFGGLMPLVLKHNSVVALPTVFGVATSLPVLILSMVIVFSANGIGPIYRNIAKIERALRLLTGSVFLLLGLYRSLSAI